MTGAKNARWRSVWRVPHRLKDARERWRKHELHRGWRVLVVEWVGKGRPNLNALYTEDWRKVPRPHAEGYYEKEG
jgi:hypothetical protein